MSKRMLSSLLLTLLAVSVLMTGSLSAQSTVSSGSIQGTVTDPSGAIIPDAKVVITNTSTGQAQTLTSNSQGHYAAGSLQPGPYTVEVSKEGFPTQKLSLEVQVGVNSTGDVKMTVGSATQTVEVTGSQIAIDTTEPTVQGVLTPEQIQELPVDGNNFLNLAQLEPGVQLQDGQTFDPTKAGYSSVSINGVNGRTARIELDGVDVSDETVGTTVLNIASSSLQEFQIARSSLDPSSELTSSGAINVDTQYGKNKYHGEGFGYFRDRRIGFANSPGGLSNPFQRSQFGGNFGGALIKDKLFFFLDSERVKQDQKQPQSFAAPFTSLNGGFNSPFRDTYSVGKLDFNGPWGMKMFYRFAFEENLSAANFGFGYAVYKNRDNTPAQAAGVDFTTGNFTHSFRFGYLKFHNMIGDATNGGGIYNPLPGVNIDVTDIGLQTGPNLLAPQQTYQSDHQVKYDGSKISGNHVFRYGMSYNLINGGGFASFFGLGPQVITSYSGAVASGLSPSDANPLDYPIEFVIMGNGQGYFTEKPAFGAPAGGQQDKRFSAYFGDNWKILPNFTFTAALRYNRDTGRSDADLNPIPCSEVNASIVAAGAAPCTGSTPLFDALQPGLGAKIRQPNNNFGPQLGFAWDISKKGTTVIRAGAGLYYENSIFNNTLFDRPAKLSKGLFFGTGFLCGGINSFTFPTANGAGNTVTTFNGQNISDICNGTIGSEGATLAAFQQAFQAATKAAGAASNGNYVGNTLAIPAAAGLSAYSPNYISPRSYQMNVGIQQQVWHGGVFSADLIRNVGLHFPLTIDANHVGDAKYLDVNAATNAIGATTAAFGCSGTNSAAIDCAIAAGATINDFAHNGLDSGVALNGGYPSGGVAAFPGKNPLFGQMLFQYYGGRSVYDGLQLNYRQQIGHSMGYGFVKGGNLEVSYTLSRFNSNGGNDQNFSAVAADFNNPTRYFGPTALDRTHQLSFGGVFDFKYGPRLAVISHFYSAPPSTLTVSDNGSPTAQIFQTDYTGDGTVQDILPGTNPGAFGRSVAPGDMGLVIQNYNNTQAGTLTPAGQALVNAGLFTQSQLVALGGAKPRLYVPSQALDGPQYGNGTLRTFDFRLSYPIKIGEEGISIEPSVGFFNLFNFSNFGSLNGALVTDPNPLGTVLTTSLAATGTVQNSNRNAIRTGNGSGTFAQGSPREMEFGLRISF